MVFSTIQNTVNDFFYTEPLPPITETRLLCKAHQTGKTGYVQSIADLYAVYNKIKAESPESVDFSYSRLKSYLKYGTCSAMSLDFVKRYLTSSIMPLSERVDKVCKKYAEGSNIEFRTQQAAFNAITKAQVQYVDDFKKDKVQALANYHDLKITYASKTFFFHSSQTKQDFIDMINEAPNGIYLIRSLFLENNHKEERRGHSMVFIQTNEGGYFFNPNEGTTQIAKGDEGKVLFQKLTHVSNKWSLDDATFYRLEERS